MAHSENQFPIHILRGYVPTLKGDCKDDNKIKYAKHYIFRLGGVQICKTNKK